MNIRKLPQLLRFENYLHEGMPVVWMDGNLIETGTLLMQRSAWMVHHERITHLSQCSVTNLSAKAHLDMRKAHGFFCGLQLLGRMAAVHESCLFPNRSTLPQLIDDLASRVGVYIDMVEPEVERVYVKQGNRFLEYTDEDHIKMPDYTGILAKVLEGATPWK